MATSSLRQALLDVGADYAVELCGALAYRGAADLPEPGQLCLRVLQEPSPLLRSVEPHLLDFESPWSFDEHFFERYMQYMAYVASPGVTAGLATIVEMTQCGTT
jgi:hypothetical protein